MSEVFLKGAVSLPTADETIQVSDLGYAIDIQSHIFYENKIYSLQKLPTEMGRNTTFGLFVCDRDLKNNKLLYALGIYGAYCKYAIMGRFAYLYPYSGTASVSVMYKINIDTNEKEEITLGTPVSFGVGLLSIGSYLYAVGNLFGLPDVQDGSNNYVYRSEDGISWQQIHDQDILTNDNVIDYNNLSTYPPSKNYNVGDRYVPYFLGANPQAFAFNSKIYAGFVPPYHSNFSTYAIYEFDLTTAQWTLAFVAKPPMVSASDYDVSMFVYPSVVSVDDSAIRFLLCNTPSQSVYPTYVGEIKINKDGSQSFYKSALPTGSSELQEYSMSLYTGVQSKTPVGFVNGQWFFIGARVGDGVVSSTNKSIIYNSSDHSWSEQAKSDDPLTVTLPFVDFNDKILTVGSDLTRLYCSSNGMHWEQSTNLPFAFKNGCLLFSHQNQLIFFDFQHALKSFTDETSNGATTTVLRINWHTFNGQTWASEIKSLELGASAPYLISYSMTKHWQQVIVSDKLIIPISYSSYPAEMFTCFALNLNTFDASVIAIPSPMYYQNDAQIATVQGVVQIPDIAAGNQLIVSAGSMITNYAIADAYFGTNSRVVSPLIGMGL